VRLRRRTGWLAGAGRWLVAGAMVAAVGGVPAAAVAAPVVSPLAAGGAVATVRLVTGDEVTVTRVAGGRPTYLVRPETGGGVGSYQGGNGDHYVIPAVAQPFVGRQLDLSLFDVTALAAAGTDRLPVTATFTAGTTPSAPPGVTFTSVTGTVSTGTVATGYLTAASEPAFARALRARIGADVAAGRQPGTAPIQAGLTSMRLAGAGQTAAVQPRYPLHPLQIDVTDGTGAPAAEGIVYLFDTDDFTRISQIVEVIDGVARIQVPAGNYSVYAPFQHFDAQGDVTELRNVSVGDFTVADTGTSTVSVDERTATSLVSVTTPRPATQVQLMLEYERTDGLGNTVTIAPTTGSAPLYVNPQPAARVGALRFVVLWTGLATNAADAYRYDVAFHADRVPVDETYAARPEQLAVVHHHFSADPAGGTVGGGFEAAPTEGSDDPFTTLVLPAPTQAMPAVLTEYVGTGDGEQWRQLTLTPSFVVWASDVRTFRAGRSYSVDWGHGPLAAGFGQHTGPSLCSACVSGSTLSLGFDPLRDSEPDHNEAFLTKQDTTHFTLYRDGAVVADLGNGYTGAVLQDIPATAGTYRAVFDRSSPSFLRSSATHTDVTMAYSPAVDAGSTLPAEDTCLYGQAATEPCQILPALTLTERLAVDATNTSDLATQTMSLRVGHLRYDGAGSRAAITSVTVSVSFDGGTTWQPAAVSGSAGCYAASWANPASARGSAPALRVTATDAAGGSITQTVTAAYAIAS
jgi:hypothetical protein